MKHFKYYSYIIIFLALVVSILIIIKNTHTKLIVPKETAQQKTETAQTVALTPLRPPKEVCYIYNAESGNSATLRMMFAGAGGSQVFGVFVYRTNDTITAAGPISGTAGKLDQKAMARTADLVWQTSQTTKEKLTVVFGDGMAYPKSALTPKSLPLQQTDCGDSVVQRR